jgi:hypothetical protein
VYVNKKFEEVTGYTRQVVLGTNCRFLQTPPHGQTIDPDLHAANRRQVRRRQHATDAPRPAGSHEQSIAAGPSTCSSKTTAHLASASSIWQAAARSRPVAIARNAQLALRPVCDSTLTPTFYIGVQFDLVGAQARAYLSNHMQGTSVAMGSVVPDLSHLRPFLDLLPVKIEPYSAGANSVSTEPPCTTSSSSSAPIAPTATLD